MFSLLQNIRTDSVVHRASYSMARVTFSGVTRLGLEVHHSPPRSAGVICLHGMERCTFTHRIRGWVGPRAINSLATTELGAEWAPGP
jgi:hypothetical protein